MIEKEKTNKFANALVKTLLEERKKLGMSHETLSKAAGISRQAVGKIEAGERNPTMQTVYKLVKAMNLSLVEFVKKMDID